MASKPMTDAERSPVLKAFGQAVRECRRARGFSQEGFAHYCGLDRSYMGGVERGERNVTLANMERIIAALHMKPSEFFLALDAHFRDITEQLKTVHLQGFAPHYLQGINRQAP
ncbi:helix-turn-helix domain-containing protein [Comamonas thiooxydans]|jgi:transcriptional regulator with XRE-family HTH domain|uniref:helix-turn-helix domain-containing protein n=1 Tax=Comamonas thiooxydans TaxID=363952 RepID=UPI0034271DE8